MEYMSNDLHKYPRVPPYSALEGVSGFLGSYRCPPVM